MRPWHAAAALFAIAVVAWLLARPAPERAADAAAVIAAAAPQRPRSANTPEDPRQPVAAAARSALPAEARPARPPAAQPAAGGKPERGPRAASPRPATASGVQVRRFVPGSKGHAEVIAATVAAPDYQETVAPLARLYFGYFGRAPDYEGLRHYIDERGVGSPLAGIADEFAGSAEFDGRYGALDNAAFVDRVHLNVMGGAADAAQRAHWIEQLDAGAITRGELMLALSESARFRSRTANPVFVAMAYAEALGRAPTPAELARWVAALDAGRPRAEVIQDLLRRRPAR